jgi:hypothetical protein
MKIDPHRLRARLLAAAAAALIAACGGGGGGDNDQGSGGGPPNPPPVGGTNVLAGGWSGSAGAGESAQVFVLADGSTWVFTKSADEVPQEMFFGGLALNSGSLSSTGMRAFDYDARTASGASASGSYVVGSSMAFTVTLDGASSGTAISLSSVGPTDYNPAQAASLAAIAGPWGGNFRPSETGVLAVASDGRIENFTTSLGCSGFGTLTPRANENVFDLSLTLGPAPCAAPNAVATGTAYVVGSGSTARIYLGVKTADGLQGASFIGRRP